MPGDTGRDAGKADGGDGGSNDSGNDGGRDNDTGGYGGYGDDEGGWGDFGDARDVGPSTAGGVGPRGRGGAGEGLGDVSSAYDGAFGSGSVLGDIMGLNTAPLGWSATGGEVAPGTLGRAAANMSLGGMSDLDTSAQLANLGVGYLDRSFKYGMGMLDAISQGPVSKQLARVANLAAGVANPAVGLGLSIGDALQNAALTGSPQRALGLGGSILGSKLGGALGADLAGGYGGILGGMAGSRLGRALGTGIGSGEGTMGGQPGGTQASDGGNGNFTDSTSPQPSRAASLNQVFSSAPNNLQSLATLAKLYQLSQQTKTPDYGKIMQFTTLLDLVR